MAVLGTLAVFHCEPIPCDLAVLVRLVADLRPSQLCLDITREQWEQRKFDELPPEYREASFRWHIRRISSSYPVPGNACHKNYRLPPGAAESSPCCDDA